MRAFAKTSPEHYGGPGPGAGVGARAVFARRGGDPGGRGGLRRAGLPADRDCHRVLVGEQRHHFKVFKPVADVTDDDLPPYWMKRSLAVSDDFQCECC